MRARKGDTVHIEYTAWDPRDEVVDATDGTPLAFTLGEGEVIPGLERAVKGMEEGSTQRVEVPPDQAYGYPLEDAEVEVPRDAFPQGFHPEPGEVLEMEDEAGALAYVTVVDVTSTHVTVDQNHPLAGKTLTFDIELVQVDR